MLTVLPQEVSKVPEQCIRLIDEIVQLRKDKGWTQQALSKASGLSQSVIARIESKKTVPTIVTLHKIVSALNAVISIH